MDDPNQNYNCPIGPVYALQAWGNVPWSLPEHYQDILFGDLDGDGKDELDVRDGAVDEKIQHRTIETVKRAVL